MSAACAFVFPGQGSQSVGMLTEVAQAYPEVQSVFAVASDVLGYDLWELCETGPAEKLAQTEYTQPALLVASVALWQLVQHHSELRPQLLAGHSLGEYSALVCAEAIPFDEAISLVALRGRLMQQAVPEGMGAMAAILGLDDEVVAACCEAAAAGQIVTAANFNSIGQVVISGHAEAVVRAIDIAKEKGAKIAKLIPVSVPSHCQLMASAAEEFAQAVAKLEISQPLIPVLHNVDFSSHQDPEAIRQALVQQLCQPVRWVNTIQSMQAQGIQRIYECGPGKVLTGLTKRIDRSVESIALNSLSALNNIS